MRFSRYGIALGTALLITVTPAIADNYPLTLFHTNDLHGRTDQYPQLITTLNEAREAYGEGILLDAGDVFSGTLYFTEFQGQDALEFMNLMGYDAFVPGNHEFDLGDPDEGHQALAAFFAGAAFPILGANLDFSAASEFTDMFGEPVSSDSQAGMLYDGIIVEHNGEPIGIFGLSTQSSETISSPGQITINDYRQAAEAMVASFEERGVNKIIALTHLGYDSDPSVGNDLLLAQHVAGIDIIIGGHSHTRVSPPTLVTENHAGAPQAPTIIGQAGEYGQHLGVMQVTFDTDGVVQDVAGELLATSERDADSDALERLEPYTAAIEALRDTQVGATVMSALPNPRHGRGDLRSVRASETALGNLITDAQLYAARKVAPETVLAIQNSGGIREALGAGDVSVGDLITVQPFGNRLALLKVTGAELLETFETALSNAPDENGGFLQVSAGVELVYDSREPVGERVVSLTIAQEDAAMQAIEPEHTYTIATNNFTAAGGDSHAVLGAAYEDGRNTIVGNTDWEMLRDYLVSLGEVTYQEEGRIVDLAERD